MQQDKQMSNPQLLVGSQSVKAHRRKGKAQFFSCMRDAWEHGFCSASQNPSVALTQVPWGS